MHSSLTISRLHVRLGKADILKGIDLTVHQGEIVALLGRSGSGKSTLLRSIAGLEAPLSGKVELSGMTVFSDEDGIDVPPERRNLGLVFQSYALWPHKTVFENVAYGLKIRGTPSDAVRAQVMETLGSVGLLDLADRYSHQLSGGQQQRVALVRAIVYSPPIVLLDEPLSNLDAKLRDEARIWIRHVIKERGLTGIFVTHDQVEAMAIADKVVLMKDGQVEQQGLPEDLYEHPASLFAAQFMGSNLSWRGRLETVSGTNCTVRFGANVMNATVMSSDKAPGDLVEVILRVRSVRVGSQNDENAVRASLVASFYVGGEWDNILSNDHGEWRVITRKRLKSDQHWLSADTSDIWVY